MTEGNCKRSFGAMHLSALLIVFGFHLIAFIAGTENEYFTSIAGIEELLITEHILLHDLKHYVDISKKYIQILQRDINDIEMEHNLAYKDVEGYIANPINVYKLINRLYMNWDIYVEQIDQLNDILNDIKKNREHFSFPSQEDFRESAVSLIRLQQTYQLPVSQVASGILNGVKCSMDMSWMDCLVLGQQFYQMRIYNQTRMWYTETVERLIQEYYHILDNNSIDNLKILETNLPRMDLDDTASKLANIIAYVEPLRHRTLKKLFDSMIPMTKEKLEEMEDIHKKHGLAPYHESEEFKLYEKMCRGELRQSPREQRDLYCQYERNPKCAFCYLAPFKVEIVSHEPLIRILHGIISDEAIETIKNLALPHMKRSQVFAPNGGSNPRNYRVSKNTWLPYNRHPYLMNILRNIHDLSGLDMTYSEQLQVANYGLGGHYEPHFDFFLKNIPQQPGNRISTAIFYLSDVEQGGDTVFPHLKVAVKPVKGTVLFWYNLHRSTDRDYRTKHGACPVLRGSKWIGNVWTHERNQELIRPCLLYRDNELSLQYKVIK